MAGNHDNVKNPHTVRLNSHYYTMLHKIVEATKRSKRQEVYHLIEEKYNDLLRSGVLEPEALRSDSME